MTSQETLLSWFGAIQFNKITVAQDHTTKTWLSNHPKSGRLKDLSAIGIKRFEILETEEISPVMHRHIVSVTHKKGKSKIQLMTIKESAPYNPSIAGTWGVNPVSWEAK